MTMVPKVSIVYGALRSGTTMFRLMLDHHPRIWAPGESDFLFDHLYWDVDRQSLAIDAEALMRDRIKNAHLDAVNFGADAVETVRNMVVQLAEGRDHITLVLHRGLDRALEIFPQAQVVHLLRDPRDVARSCIGMGWAGTVWHGLDNWLHTEALWDKAAADLPQEQVSALRYEDLIAATEQELTRTCAFLGLPYDDAMLTYDRSSTYDRPDPKLVYQWQRKMSVRDIQLAEGRLGARLTHAGYVASGHDPAQPGTWESAVLYWRNKRGRWAHAINRYGLIDPLLLAVANRTRQRWLAFLAQSRIDRKVVLYLK